jgi:hypothetical protein
MAVRTIPAIIIGYIIASSVFDPELELYSVLEDDVEVVEFVGETEAPEGVFVPVIASGLPLTVLE